MIPKTSDLICRLSFILHMSEQIVLYHLVLSDVLDSMVTSTNVACYPAVSA